MTLCPLCSSKRFVKLYPASRSRQVSDNKLFDCTSPSYGVHSPVYKCRNCEFVFLIDKSTPGQIVKHYEQVNDPDYVAEETARIKTFGRHLQNISHLKRGQLLDVGAYTGLFVYLAKKQKWQAKGLEPSGWAVAQAKKRYGLTLKKGVLHPRHFKAGSFDMVTMWDVVEHFTNPVSALKICHRFLKPNGWLVMSTIDIGSITAQILGPRWPWLMQMHRVYFSKSTMIKALTDLGFRNIYFKPHIRYIGLGYVWNRFLPNVLPQSWQNKIIPFYLGDLFDVYAQK